MDIKAREKELKAEMLEPITPIQARSYRRIMTFKCITKYDIKRLYSMVRLYNSSINLVIDNNKENDGLFGDIVELTSHRPTSTITKVRPQGRNDSYIIVNDKRYKLEIKTNSGEMQDFMTMKSNELVKTYIYYVMDINVKPSKFNTTGIRQIEFLSTLEHFMNRCYEYEAIKPNGNKYNLRADKKKLYQAFIEDYENGLVIPFDRRMTYCLEDFEE